MDEISPESLYRVFISAPEDVLAEYTLAARVFEEVAQEFGGRIGFSITRGTTGSEPMEDRPSGFNLVICLLWKGLGPTLRSTYDRPDGTPRTGIEFEFEDALDSALSREMPDILVYKKRVLIDVERAEAAASDLRALNAFWQKWFRNEQGQYTASFEAFETPTEFGDKLRRHVRHWLLRRRHNVIWPAELKGSPYRSLEPFEPEHATVFFGRRHAIRQVVAKLAAAAAKGCGFVVIMGGSGTGKSSLARAGIIPWLTERGVVPDVAEWRSAIVRPATMGEDALAALARILFERGVLPELAESDYSNPERFAAIAARSPEAAAILVSTALRSIRPTRETRLILLMDQLEELLTRPPESLDGVVAFLEALARSGRVWVIATLRSDRYPEFQSCPGLVRLKDEGSSYDLLPPDQVEIRDIIEGPARAAGLSLEESGERSLAVVLEDAARDRAALPLLEFTLHRLFLERDAASGTLLLSVYDRFGGLAGAIAGEAERTVASLPERLRATLPRLLINLVDIDVGKGAVSARQLLRSELADPNVFALADRMVEGRFLVLDGKGSEATLRLAHEALIMHWPRLADVVRDHRAFLGTRNRIDAEAAEWLARGRHPDFLLPSGRGLAEAANALAEYRTDLDKETTAYIEASIEAERHRVDQREAADRQALQERVEAAEAREHLARRLVRRTGIAAAIVTVILVAAVATGALWLSQRSLAQARAVEAEKNYATALKAASEGVRLVALARAAGQLPNDVASELLEATRSAIDRLGNSSESKVVMETRDELFDQMAQAAYLSGRTSDALAWARKELPSVTERAAHEPSNEKWQQSVMRAQELLGQLSEQAGNLPAAVKQYKDMIERTDRMVAKLPDSRVWRAWKSAAVSHQAATYRAQGYLPQAVASYREALARFALTAETAGATPWDRYRVAATRLGLANVLLMQGDNSSAMEQCRAALTSFKSLGDNEKSNQNWQFSIALANSELGDALRTGGDLDGAYEAFQESISVEMRLAAADRTNYLLENNFAAAARGKADVFLDEGQTQKALKLYRTVLKIVERLAEHDSTNTSWQRNLGQMHGRVGDVLMDMQEIRSAEEEYRAGFAITQRLAAMDPSNADWQRELSLSHARMGNLLNAKGDKLGALVEDRARLAILLRLVDKDSTNVTWRRDLIAAHGRLGVILAALDEGAAAHDEFVACVALGRVAAPDTDTVYNRHEDLRDFCERQIGGADSALRQPGTSE